MQRLTHALLNSVISNDLECLSKIFNGTKRRAVSLRQLSYLYLLPFCINCNLRMLKFIIIFCEDRMHWGPMRRDISRIWKVGGGCKIKVGRISSRSEIFFFSAPPPKWGANTTPWGCKHPRIWHRFKKSRDSTASKQSQRRCVCSLA